MIFDQPPAELPVAKLRSHDGKAQLAADLRAWLAAKWQWFKPRTIPLIVAFMGMLAVIGSANWLRNYARRAPERLEATATPGKIIVDVSPPGAIVTIDGRPILPPTIVIEPGCKHSITIEPE